MKKLLLTLVSACVLLSVTNVFADSTKIGVIDVREIMQKSPQVAALNAKLTKEFQPRQGKIQAAQKTLQAEIDNLNRNGTTMSDADRNKLQDQIIADRSNVQGMILAFQRDVNTEQTQDMQGFIQKLKTAVDDVAKKGNYDLILQRAGVPYVSPSLDITNQVLAELGN
jgi:outer membrane protein